MATSALYDKLGGSDDEVRNRYRQLINETGIQPDQALNLLDLELDLLSGIEKMEITKSRGTVHVNLAISAEFQNVLDKIGTKNPRNKQKLMKIVACLIHNMHLLGIIKCAEKSKEPPRKRRKKFQMGSAKHSEMQCGDVSSTRHMEDYLAALSIQTNSLVSDQREGYCLDALDKDSSQQNSLQFGVDLWENASQELEITAEEPDVMDSLELHWDPALEKNNSKTIDDVDGINVNIGMNSSAEEVEKSDGSSVYRRDSPVVTGQTEKIDEPSQSICYEFVSNQEVQAQTADHKCVNKRAALSDFENTFRGVRAKEDIFNSFVNTDDNIRMESDHEHNRIASQKVSDLELTEDEREIFLETEVNEVECIKRTREGFEYIVTSSGNKATSERNECDTTSALNMTDGVTIRLVSNYNETRHGKSTHCELERNGNGCRTETK